MSIAFDNSDRYPRIDAASMGARHNPSTTRRCRQISGAKSCTPSPIPRPRTWHAPCPRVASLGVCSGHAGTPCGRWLAFAGQHDVDCDARQSRWPPLFGVARAGPVRQPRAKATGASARAASRSSRHNRLSSVVCRQFTYPNRSQTVPAPLPRPPVAARARRLAGCSGRVDSQPCCRSCGVAPVDRDSGRGRVRTPRRLFRVSRGWGGRCRWVRRHRRRC